MTDIQKGSVLNDPAKAGILTLCLFQYAFITDAVREKG